MKQGSEAFKQNLVDSSEEPEKKEGGIVLPFKLKPRTYESATERARGYKEYKALGGILDEMEYQDILGRIDSVRNTPLNSSTPLQAKSMASAAGITLSPETIALYGVLRHYEEPNPDAKEHYSTLNDQKVLAEALRLVGDKDSLATFIETHPHIFN